MSLPLFEDTYESFAHYKIRAGGTFNVRRIDVDPPVSDTLVIPKFKEQVVFYDLNELVDNNVYYKPWSKTFVAVDGISSVTHQLSTTTYSHYQFSPTYLHGSIQNHKRLLSGAMFPGR